MGLAKIGTLQPILGILCYPSDYPPGTGDFNGPEERALQVNVNQHLVSRYLEQMSYGKFTLAWAHTDWIRLPETIDYYNRADNGATMFADAVIGARAAGWEDSRFQCLLAIVTTPRFRTRYNIGIERPVRDSTGAIVSFAHRPHRIYIDSTTHWGTRAHEIGHSISLADIYAGQGWIHDAKRWDWGGNSNEAPLSSGSNMFSDGWYDGNNIVELKHGNPARFDKTYTVRAHDRAESTNSAAHLIMLKMPFMSYWIEVRQQPEDTPRELRNTSEGTTVLQQAVDAYLRNPNVTLFDNNTPIPGSVPHRGGVIITKRINRFAQEWGSINQLIRDTTLLTTEVLQEGQHTGDPLRGLRIDVLEMSTPRPLTFRIRVRWQYPLVAPNRAGMSNLRIRPHSSLSHATAPLEWFEGQTASRSPSPDPHIASGNSSVDIVVNSSSDGILPSPLVSEGNAFSRDLGGQQRPKVGEWNRCHVRVFNSGPRAVENAVVGLYIRGHRRSGNSDEYVWIPLRIGQIPLIPSGECTIFPDPAWPGTKQFAWFPQRNERTVLAFVVQPQDDEWSIIDNAAAIIVESFQVADN